MNDAAEAGFEGALRYLLSTPDGVAFLADDARVAALFGPQPQRTVPQRRDEGGMLRAMVRMNEGIEDIRRAIVGGDVKTVMLHELKSIETQILQMHKDLASLRPDDDGASNRITTATEELDAIVRATEDATNTILTAAETVQMIGDALDEEDRNAIGAEMGRIMEACSFQDITGQRIAKVVATLHFLENRINAMLQLWESSGKAMPPAMPGDTRPDAHLLNGPQLDGKGNDQSAIDALFN